MNCTKCKKDFEFIKQRRIVKKYSIKRACPHCGKLYKEKITKLDDTVNYRILDNGQIVRKEPKIKMSKKERLKRRRAQNAN